MDKIGSKLTVYFEEPFWVGIFERMMDGNFPDYINKCSEGIWKSGLPR